MLKLYQFPISHFCEKARWALDYKQLEYKKINLLPGLHIKKARKLSGKAQLPILVDNNRVFSESSVIIDHLDTIHPKKLLTPENEAQKCEALKWEAFADHELGPDVRGLCYNTLLDYPEITIPFFSIEGPWYSDLYLKYSFPKLSIKMRELMKLDNRNVSLIKKRLAIALDKLYRHTQQCEYLASNQFSRADLAVAALLAPLCKPEKYGLEWPDQYPDPLQSSIDEFGNKLDWVKQIYSKHR